MSDETVEKRPAYRADNPVPDPAPVDSIIPGKSHDRMRAIAPRLLAALVTDTPLPHEAVPAVQAKPKVRRPAYDVGPAARLAHGNIDLATSRPDPDREMRDQAGVVVGYHQTTGARVRSGHDYLLSRGTITSVQHHAATRYLDTVERLNGARSEPTEGAGRVPPHQQGSPAEDQVNAASDLRRASAALGAIGGHIVQAVVCEGVTLGRLAHQFAEDEKSIAGRLRAALDRLGEVWG